MSAELNECIMTDLPVLEASSGSSREGSAPRRTGWAARLPHVLARERPIGEWTLLSLIREMCRMGKAHYTSHRRAASSLRQQPMAALDALENWIWRRRAPWLASRGRRSITASVVRFGSSESRAFSDLAREDEA